MIFITTLLVVLVLYGLFMSPYVQLFGKYPYKIDTTEKIVALTFDDGPNGRDTEMLLDVLKRHNVKATFFVVGSCINRWPKLLARIATENHTVGVHSMKHRFRDYFVPGQFMKEVKQLLLLIERKVGKRPQLMRTPWLWRQPAMLHQARKLRLLPVSGVFCHPLEVFGATPEKIARQAIKQAKPGRILIFHDGKEGVGGDRSRTVRAVEILITSLQKQGYKFVTVDKLLSVSPYL